MGAYDKNFILSLVKELIPTLRKIDGKKSLIGYLKDSKSEMDNLPFHPTYSFTVNMYERIKVHSELCEFPEQIFKSRSPRMTEDEAKYLRDNYKQVTMPVYLDFLSTLLRIFHEPNYSLEYQEDETKIANEKGLQEYLETEIPEFKSLESYMKTIAMHCKFTDANGVIGVRPKEIKLVPLENGQVAADDSSLSEPIPIYFRCDQVILDEPGEYYLFMSDEKSMVRVGDKNQKSGHVFEFWDTENIWKIEQTGKKEEYKFKATLFYNHDRERIPATKLKGVPALKNGRLVWISPFMYCVDLLDLVAMNSSYLEVIIVNCVFPYRVMYGDDCEYEYTDELGQKSSCQSGYVWNSKLEHSIICPNCSGTGLRSRINPFGVMLIRTGNGTSPSDKDVPQQPMTFVEPSIETPKFLMGLIADYTSKARAILHLNTTSTQVQGGVNMFNPADTTATGMAMDTKAKDAFVKPQSDQIFECWEFIIDEIGNQRYADKYKKPILRFPSTFDFYSEQDYMNNIANAVKAQLPPMVIQTILFRYLQSVFYNETSTINVFNLIYNTDRIIVMSQADIANKFNRGLIDKWEVVLHDSAITLVRELMLDKKFFEKDFKDQQAELIELAKTRADQISDSQNTSGDSAGNNGASDNIQKILESAKARAAASA